MVNKQGQKSIKTTKKISRPLVYFRNEGQKLGILLEDSVSKFEAIKKFSNNKCSFKWIF